MNFKEVAKSYLQQEREELNNIAKEYAQLRLEEKEIKNKLTTLKNKMVAMDMIGESVETEQGTVSIYKAQKLKADFKLITKLQKEGVDTSELYSQKIDAEKVKKLGKDRPELTQHFEYSEFVGVRFSESR